MLPPSDGPTHRYLGASAACWALYTSLQAGEPPVVLTPAVTQMVDAYCAQHHGTLSNQATQSVAVHLIALYAAFIKNTAVERLVWVRQRSLRTKPGQKHGRFHWLTPPDFTGALTAAEIANAANPRARADLAERYVRQVWKLWAHEHFETVAQWYEQYVVKD
jgi:hypothetical protein